MAQAPPPRQPSALRAVEFAVARAAELRDVADALADEPRPKRPRLLRRRARSHAPNPWRARFRGARESKRRRLALDEFAAEGSEGSDADADGEAADESAADALVQLPTRLETHVWHAKRFEMEALGGSGVCVPLRARDRGERSAVRAATRPEGALMHDVSYEWIAEIRGERAAVRLALQLCVSHVAPEAATRAPTDAAAAPGDDAAAGADCDGVDERARVESGARAGFGMLHWPELAPAALVCPVVVLWRPARARGAAAAAGDDDGADDADGDANDGDDDDDAAPALAWVQCHCEAWREAIGALRAAAARAGAAGAGLASVRGGPASVCAFEMLGAGCTRALLPLLAGAERGAAAAAARGGGAGEAAGVDAERAAPPLSALQRAAHSERTGRAARCGEALAACVALPGAGGGPGGADAEPVSTAAALWSASARARVARDVLTQRDASRAPPAPAAGRERAALRVPLVLVRQRAPREWVDAAVGGRALNRFERDALTGWRLFVPAAAAPALWCWLARQRLRAIGGAERRALRLQSAEPHFPRDFPDAAAGRAAERAAAARAAAAQAARPPGRRDVVFAPAGAAGGATARGAPTLAAPSAAVERAPPDWLAALALPAPRAHALAPAAQAQPLAAGEAALGHARAQPRTSRDRRRARRATLARAPSDGGGAEAAAAAEPTAPAAGGAQPRPSAASPPALAPVAAPAAPVPAAAVVPAASAPFVAQLEPAAEMHFCVPRAPDELRALALAGARGEAAGGLWRQLLPRCLLLVHARCVGRGAPADGAMLFAPPADDLSARRCAPARWAAARAAAHREGAFGAEPAERPRLIGYLTSTGRSKAQGCAVGVGHVSATAALELLRAAADAGEGGGQGPALGFCALMRNLTSPAYRPVVLHLLLAPV